MTARRGPLEAMRSDGLVPLYGSGDAGELHAVATALVGAGLSTFEVTIRTPGSLEALETLVARARAEDMPLQIGAGTVMDAPTAEAVIAAGARFAFSPVVTEDVAAPCRAAGIPYIPGCATPTEIHRALALGCTTVKLFPAATIGGPGFLRAVRPVFPEMHAIPSGGIPLDTRAIRDWFDAGAVAVAMGSQLIGSVDRETDGELAQRLAGAVAAIADARRAGQE